MKKLLLSVAVATFVAAPIAQAGSSLTGSLRYGIAVDNADETDITLRNFGSRVKMAGDTAISDSTTGYGKIEFRLADSVNGGVVNRLYAVGAKGTFGDISVGVQDTAFDQSTSDVTWWNGANVGLVGDRSEKNGAIVYKKDFGSLKLTVGAALQATIAGDDTREEDVDLIDATLGYSSDVFSIVGGFQTKELGSEIGGTDETGTAVSVTGVYNFGAGSVNLTLGAEDEEFTGTVDRTALLTQVAVGDFYGFFGASDEDDLDVTQTLVGIGYTQNLSEQSLIWYELFSTDNDDGSDTETSFHAAYKIDF